MWALAQNGKFHGSLFALLIAGLWLLAGTAGIMVYDGTGDAGDSITHYLFARYAPSHPELFFHHWAKPLFVLLASPLAQTGFEGMQMFNLFVSAGTIYLTYLVAAEMRLRRPWMAALIIAAFPQYFVLTLSGLTEPLFALFSAGAILLFARDRYRTACIVVSFMPFIRSEGLILAGIAMMYVMYRRRLRLAPWLLAGSLFYSLSGWFVHRDLLWVFTKIPYATVERVYGSGTWYHFFDQLYYCIGFPGTILIVSGVLFLVIQLFQRRASNDFLILVAGSFIAFFIAHALFWYLGIFASMGMKRVLYCIFPQAALLCLCGMNWLEDKAGPKWGKALAVAFVLYLAVFPFTPNPAAIIANRDLVKSNELIAADSAVACIQNAWNGDAILYDHQYISLALERDHFDPEERIPLNHANISSMSNGQLLIYDNSPSRSASEIDDHDPALEKLEKLCEYQVPGSGVFFAVYRKP